MGKNIGISYAITACNEAEELFRLLERIKPHLSRIDEVIIQLDVTSTDEVKRIATSFVGELIDKVIQFPLNGDFAVFKNNLKNHCTKEYIFYIDADEMPTEILLRDLEDLIADAKNTSQGHDLILYIPRVNIVHGITEDDIKNYNWGVNELGYINFPDYQGRICTNSKDIEWESSVHEKLQGGMVMALPPDIHYSLYHIKSIDKQRKQNEFYDTIDGSQNR